MNVFMTDHTPSASARYVPDRLVATCITEYVRLLSAAWHFMDNAQFDELKDKMRETPWLVLKVLPPTTGHEPKAIERRALAAGENPNAGWDLHGQRIFAAYGSWWDQYPHVSWICESGGNYDWVWRMTAWLCVRHKLITGAHHNYERQVWTLEAQPPSLAGSKAVWSEAPPEMPERYKVVVDGFYETTESYRMYIATRPRELLAWTGVSRPDWIDNYKEPPTA